MTRRTLLLPSTLLVLLTACTDRGAPAFDGDDGTLYWQRNLTAAGMRPPRNTDMTNACGGGYQDFSGNIGIVGSPAIDSASGTLSVVARSTTGVQYAQHLHAVSITDGHELAGFVLPSVAASEPNGRCSAVPAPRTGSSGLLAEASAAPYP